MTLKVLIPIAGLFLITAAAYLTGGTQAAAATEPTTVERSAFQNCMARCTGRSPKSYRCSSYCSRQTR